MKKRRKRHSKDREATGATTENEATTEKDEGAFEKNEDFFSPPARSVIFGEPRLVFRFAFLVVFAAVSAILVWSYFSWVNISFFLPGQVVPFDPDVGASVDEKFEVVSVPAFIGKPVTKEESLVRVRIGGRAADVRAPISGTVVGLLKLQRGVVYQGGTQVVVIRPESPRYGLKLIVSPDQIGKVSVGGSVVFKFTSLPATYNQIIRGRVVSPPVREDEERYVAHAILSEESEREMVGEGRGLLPGLPLTAEIVTGRERMIQRLIGFTL